MSKSVRTVGATVLVVLVLAVATALLLPPSAKPTSGVDVSRTSIGRGSETGLPGAEASGRRSQPAPSVEALAFAGRCYSYEVRARGRRVTPEDYALLGCWTFDSLNALQDEITSTPASAAATLHVVVERQGRRATLLASELRELRAEELHRHFEGEGFSQWRLAVRDRATGQPVRALLIDEQGRPYGPVPDDENVSLPADYAGLALAHDYVPGRVQMFAAGQARVELRRAAWITGRVAGAPFDDGKLWIFDLDAPVEREPDEVVEPDAQGSLSLGPIAAGRKQLRFDGSRAWLAKPHRLQDVAPGRQDLGVLGLDPLDGLHLRFLGSDGRALEGEVFVSISLFTEPPNNGIPVFSRALHEGRLSLERYPGDRLAVCAWTADGAFGESRDGIMAASTTPEAPATIALREPGSLFVRVSTTPFDVPAGCSLLVYPTPWHLQRHTLVGGEDDRPDQRVRRFALPPDGNVQIDRLWACRNGLALVSSFGTVLAESWVDIESGVRASTTLQPAERLGAIDVSASATGRRFAMVADQRGIVLRGSAGERSQRVLLPAGAYRLQGLDAQTRRQRQAVLLEPGEIRSIYLDW